ncbi:TlpA family protein disulfide reductase [Mucilaginibacter aquatilis]|uniref:Redoxin family protein n=1 Tax=Mucilaginibacter aquatilis TaxID=1517760 RepID=A0A6I4I3M3_9SPHI|nr:TlpA disulfide reductase family protein [Mucilaginibacter aquatilis]MVN89641.1 redoxin family protein [Mucilaginibacter aquatilis]
MLSLKLYTKIALLSLLPLTSLKGQEILHQDIVYLPESGIDFSSLISKFKGRVIYLDIWATWCMPCRKELTLKQDIKAFADFARKNNVVVLYICCDKNGNMWKNFIETNEMYGYHILANQQINNTLHTTFSVQRGSHGKRKLQRAFFLPRHIIIDQSGTVRDSSAQRQGTALVYRQIEEILKN